jgi:hypothetical protein
MISLSLNSPSHLLSAGVSVSEILRPDVAGILLSPAEGSQHLGGYAGIRALKQAGYSAKELMSSPCHTAWDLMKVSLILNKIANHSALTQGIDGNML